MRDFRSRPRRVFGFLLLSLGASLASGGAGAVPITDYITVQPIDVCSGGPGTTTGCAPINSSGQNYATAPVGAVGSIVSGINVTRAIWNQIGVDMTFLKPVQDPNAGTFLTLAVESEASQLTSTQFKTLSDQTGISQGQPPTPAPPLSQNPSTINMFFVNKLVPITPPGGTLYGFSWIDNNGVAIAANSLGGIGARPDTIAHELGHNLDLNHTDAFNPGAPPSNLMTAGATRALSTSANVLANLKAGTADQLNALQAAHVLDPSGFVNPIANIDTAIIAPSAILVGRCTEFATCWSSGTPTPWSDTLSLANLQALGLGTTQPFVAGQTSMSTIRLGATTMTFNTTTGTVIDTLPEFNGGVHSDPCNFCEVDTVGHFLIPSNATDATISGTFGNSIVPNSAGVDLCLGGSAPCSGNDFSVAFKDAGRPGESLKTLILTAPAGTEFDPSTFSQSPSGTPGVVLTPTFSNCTEFGDEGERCQTLSLALSGTPFVLGDQADYTVGFCRVEGDTCATDSNTDDLSGATYTYQFSDGFQTTSLLQPNGDPGLDANSWTPDPMVAPDIFDEALYLEAALGQPPCTTDGACPPLTLADANPAEDNPPVPEPPSILLLACALMFAAALYPLSSRS